MTLEELKPLLEQRFDPGAATGLDAVLRLVAGEQSLVLEVRHGALGFPDPETTTADAVFMFDDVDTAWMLLTGRADAFEAFMAGRFRSDGHLMWAFTLMTMFRSASLPANPTE